MDDETARALNALNLAFYRDRAASFSDKRERPWRGWSRLLGWIPKAPPGGERDALSVLDVGCGNARFGRFLAKHRPLGLYVGLDASAPLLEIARADPPPAARVEWEVGDFVAEPPERVLPPVPASAGGFDLVALFGVLHGVPGRRRRRALLEASAARLAPGGLLVFTSWRFADDPRLGARLASPAADWERVPGVDPQQLEPGDHLLPWGPADDPAAPLRYGHSFDAAEHEALAAGLSGPGGVGLERLADFRDDGPSGDLNAYRVLQAPRPGPT